MGSKAILCNRRPTSLWPWRKSVYIINGYLRLTREEALAINWHMGGFDKRVIAGDYSMSKSYYKYPICTLTHIADIMATYLDETAAD